MTDTLSYLDPYPKEDEVPKQKPEAGPQLGKGMVGGGVFVIVDEEGVLWRIDADAGTFRRCVAI